MRYVLFYSYVPDVAERIMPHLDAHLQHVRDAHARGEMPMGGQLTGTGHAQAMGVFTSREAAERFLAGDPLVRHHVVVRSEIAEFQDLFEEVGAAT